jgi:hypothetical protein
LAAANPMPVPAAAVTSTDFPSSRAWLLGESGAVT